MFERKRSGLYLCNTSMVNYRYFKWYTKNICHYIYIYIYFKNISKGVAKDTKDILKVWYRYVEIHIYIYIFKVFSWFVKWHTKGILNGILKAYVLKASSWNIKLYTKGISNDISKANYRYIRWHLKGIVKVS